MLMHKHIYAFMYLIHVRKSDIEINSTFQTLVGSVPSSGSCVSVSALEQAQTERNYWHTTPEAYREREVVSD